MAIDTHSSRKSMAGLLGPVLALAVLPGAALAADGEAAAADDQGVRAPIVVTGSREGAFNPSANPQAPYKVETSSNDKLTEPVRDTPRSVTIIPKEVLADTGATSFRDVARSTPGVTLATGEGGNAYGDRVFIRGYEARNDVYIDGMRDPGVSSREIFAVEQIEIIKGAAGTFGGRGTTGGLVSLESKKAQLRDFAVLETGLGSDAFTRVTIDANKRITNTLAIRVNGLYHDGDTPGRRQVWQKRFGGAAALHWEATPKVTLDADYYYLDLTGMADYGIPFDTRTQRPFAVDPSNFYGAVGRDFLSGGADIATVTLRYKPSEAVSLRSMTRYGAVANRYVVSVPGRPTITAANPAQWTVSVGTTQRNAISRSVDTINDATLRLDTGGISHTIVTGMEYSRERVRNRRYAFPAFVEDQAGNQIATTTTRVLNLLNPNPFLAAAVPALRDLITPDTINTVETVSGYFIDTLKFGEHVQLTGGVRYDDYAIRASGGAGAAAYDRKQHYGLLNWQASLTYKPVTAATLYASVSTSSNPSGEQLDATSDVYGGLGVGSVNLAPENNRAYEIGAKYEIAGGKLLLTAAAFRIDKDNAREQTAPNVYQLVGKLRSQGFELGASGNLTSRLAVFAGYAYLDAKIIASATPGFVGSRFANVPRHSGSILVTYALSKAITVGGQAVHRSTLFGGTFAAGAAQLPGYWRYDAVARVRLSDRFELRANVLNIGNKRYFDAIYRSAVPYSYVAPARSGTLTLTAKF